MTAFLDHLGRPLRSLRLSVTDRCNLRCAYCMPEEEYAWLPKRDILSFEEMARLVEIFVSLGIDRLRITGGEPLIRRDLESLLTDLSGLPGIQDLAMTTNGILLPEKARVLREAGLHRLTVSLDTLDPERFRRITRRDDLDRVLLGIDSLIDHGFERTKLDSVIIRGTNEDEILGLLDFAREKRLELRYIEYMDVGGATAWSRDRVVTRKEILQEIEAAHGAVEPVEEPESTAPADRYRLPDGTVFGIISSTTQPFCGSCDRSRLTADGHWFLCLYAREGVDLRAPLRAGWSTEDLAGLIRRTWGERQDRGAELRLEQEDRQAFAGVEEMKANPHLEMHTRGG